MKLILKSFKSASPFYIALCGTLLFIAATSRVHADQKTNQKNTLYLAQLRKASKNYDSSAIYQLVYTTRIQQNPDAGCSTK